MNKSITYICLAQKMSKLDFDPPFLENPVMCGNLAYFIDEYGETDEWPSLYEQINDYIEKKDINELCRFVITRIYNPAILSPKTTEEYRIVFDFIYDLAKKLYPKKKLGYFNVVGPLYYPEWFYEADYVLNGGYTKT